MGYPNIPESSNQDITYIKLKKKNSLIFDGGKSESRIGPKKGHTGLIKGKLPKIEN